MSQKLYYVNGVGEVLVSRRRGSKNIRLSVSSKGAIRINLPYWLPYSEGIKFVKTKADWVAKHKPEPPRLLRNGQRIGKGYHLRFYNSSAGRRLGYKISPREISIYVPAVANYEDVQRKALAACEKALKQEAEALLVKRVEILSRHYGYRYSEIVIKKLTSRWGSCSISKKITLSYYLIQLPWALIDYVIIHELVHTKHMNHGLAFWDEFKLLLPDAKSLQKTIRQHRPALLPADDLTLV